MAYNSVLQVKQTRNVKDMDIFVKKKWLAYRPCYETVLQISRTYNV